ncbi:MAG: DegT/DnrJ/EryC1/StrS aminotransferase family protein [Pedobacter sp.]|nr:MAG: DegT/DnrJ/EryC1/StrS aminotransferase family protein [Pedobacter sp.]
MIPRGKLDISFSSVFAGIRYCLSDLLGFKAGSGVKINKAPNEVYCLSVRTGFDLTLKSLHLNPGDELLVTNINIPDMFSIIAANGLIAVPLAVNKHTLNIKIDDIEHAITPITRGILITHLFGAIMDTSAIVALAKKHGLFVIEDCAQAFNGTYQGDIGSDVVMYSFGLIKTNTALTGAVLRFNNSELAQKIYYLNSLLPTQKTQRYLNKLFKALVIKILTLKLPYTMLYWYSKRMGNDFDEILAGFTRGFPGEDVMSKISFRPCLPNIRLLHKRLDRFDPSMIIKRTNSALKRIANLPSEMKIGSMNLSNTYWVIPIESNDPQHFINVQRAKGIDATARASSLVKIGDLGNSKDDELDLSKLVYLPPLAH